MVAPQHVEAVADDDIPVPDVSGLVTEDGTPVDSIFSEKQMRLLTESLNGSWQPPDGRAFLVAANVGVFPKPENTPLVPDVFLALDTTARQPFSEKRNRSYFVWEHGKPPDLVIEVVSNREGEELTRRLRGYERMRVSHYVVFDPWHILGSATIHRFELRGDMLVEVDPARSGEPSVAGFAPSLFPRLGLGLRLWDGVYESESATWLRWCLLDGALIPTGRERADQEAQRADHEAQRADHEAQRADHEAQRADHEAQRAERLAAKLRELGIDPSD